MTEGDEAKKERGLDVDLVENWALHYLGRYASSAENLRRVLSRRARKRLSPDEAAQAATLIAALVERYRDAGLVDDSAYAAAQVRSGMRRGQSLLRVRAKLAAKGVDAEDAEHGIRAAGGSQGSEGVDPDLAAACAFARRRRLGPFRATAANEETRARELGAFGRAGFGRATAEAVLDCADPDEAAALLAGREEA